MLNVQGLLVMCRGFSNTCIYFWFAKIYNLTTEGNPSPDIYELKTKNTK